MAIPTLSGGITNAGNTLSNADTTTGWSGTSIGTDTDIKVEGAAAVLCTLRNDLSTIQYTNGTGVNMSTQHFRGWINTTTIGQLDFMEAYLGNAFYIAFKGPGTTTNPAGVPIYRGGYQYVVVYGGNTPDSGTAPGTETAFGFRFNRVTAPANRTNTYVDVFRYGDGYTATGGTLSDPISFIGIADVDVVDAYGIVQNIRDTSFLFGEVTVGSGTTPTYMTVANEAVIFADIPVSSTLYKITATGSGCTFDATNSLFKANGTQNFRFDMSAVGTLVCDGNVFIQASPLTFGSGQTINSNTFINCGGTTTNGATIVRGSFEDCAPVVVSDLSQLSLCTFTRDDAQSVHAVELTSLGSGTMSWTCTADDGYAAGTADTFTPANDAGLDASIFVNVASGNLTINIGTGGTVPSIRTAGATVTVQQAVNFTITNIIPGSEVRLYDSNLNELGAGQSGIVGATFAATPFNTNAQGANPTGIAVDGTFAYVIAGNTGTLYKYNYAGTLQTSWSVDSTPAGVAYFNNTVYVVGGVGSSVVAYSTTGTPTGFSFSTAGQIVQESGLCFDGTHFYIADRNTDRVYRYTSAGVYDNFFFSVASQDTEPRGIEVVGDFIFVNGFTNDKAFKYTKDGIYTGVSWDLSGQTDFCAGLSYDGTLFWSTGNDNRNVFNYTPVISSSSPGIEEIGITSPGLGWTVTPDGSRYSATYSYSYSADQDVIIVIFDVDYLPLRLTDTLGNTSRSIKVEQVFDRNYEEGATPLVNP